LRLQLGATARVHLLRSILRHHYAAFAAPSIGDDVLGALYDLPAPRAKSSSVL
jgi:hypothetical protein